MNRQQYIQEYERIQRKYRKKFFPAVYKAINSIVSSLIDKIQTDGVNSAMGDLMLTIINDKIGEPVKRIYSEVGMFHVKHNYRFIRAEIGRKALGRNEIWVQEIIAYLEKNLWQYVVAKPTETLRDHFLRVLQEGIDKEWSVDDIIREIRSDQFARYQAERIVRTEVGRAANTGKKIAADSFPYEMQKEWISFQDMRTRGRVPDDKKDHYHLNGQTVAMDGTFTDPRSGEQIEYPNAPGGSPGMVINCRCTYATTPKRDSAGGLIGRTAKINVGIKPTGNRFFENTGGFTPVNSIKEAHDRISALGVSHVDLSKINVKQANSVVKALEREHSFSPLKLERVTTYRRSGSTAGAYYLTGDKEITINASALKDVKPSKLESWDERKTPLLGAIDKYKTEYLDNPKYNQIKVKSKIYQFERLVKDLDRKIEKGEVPKYYTVLNSAKDESESLEMMITHEVGHMRHYRQIGTDKYFNYRKENSVSDYGGTNEREYLAEWYTHWRYNGDYGVPSDLLKLFKSL